MKKTTRSTYKKDKYYKKVTASVHELLKDGFVVMPAEVLIQMRYLTREDYEDWRFGRVPYLERVIGCNLSKVNRILRILRLHAEDLGLRPSPTVYKKWGKGRKIFLRFSRSGTPWMEILYSTHYASSYRKANQNPTSLESIPDSSDRVPSDDLAIKSGAQV